jgi:hypothetical protein
MKYLKRASLVALGVIALGSLTQAQIIEGPEIESITPTMSYDAGPVVIFGRNLNTVFRVYVDGVEVPIDVKRARRLVIWKDNPPGDVDPGFAEVRLDALGLGQPTGVLKLLPTLAAVRYRREIQMTMNTGGPGLYSVFLSHEALDHPMTLPSVHYQLMINLDPAMSGKLVSGASFTRGPIAVVSLTMPNHVGLAGRDLYLQGWSQLGFTTDQVSINNGGRATYLGDLDDGAFYPVPVTSSFTNMVHVPTTPLEDGSDRTIDVDFRM